MTEKSKRMVRVSCLDQSRDCTWSTLCWELIGGGNKATIERVDAELKTGNSTFQLGVHEATVRSLEKEWS